MRKIISKENQTSAAQSRNPAVRLLSAIFGSIHSPGMGSDETDSRIADARMGDWTVLSVLGSMDSAMLPDLKFFADRALCVPTHVILDLRSVFQVDAAVMDMLVEMRRRAARVSRDIRIVGSAEQFKTALRTSGARDMFPVYECIADAVTATRDDGLDIQVFVAAEEAVVICRGRAESSLTPELEAAFRGIPSPVRDVDIDLRGVGIIEGEILGAIRDFADYKRESGGRVRLAVSRSVAKAIMMEGLGRSFELTGAPRRMSAARVNPFAGAQRR
jgi:anti-anti-sigma regulatory factor